MPSSSKKINLRGPRPQPLNIGRDSWIINKPKLRPAVACPVITFLQTPKVIHTRPQDFKTLVLQLTGKPQSPVGGGDQMRVGRVEDDPLVLTLGVGSSPTVAAPSLISPGFSMFSPNMHAFFQELMSEL